MSATPAPRLARRSPSTQVEGVRTEKVQSWHRDRLAIVYVRQSTPQQVLDHQESTRLQYGLVARARDLGWPSDRVVVIDDDLGKSGAHAEGRLGFQRLVSEVSLDHVGLILGVEISRLARSCKDWHQLLEICALFGTLIADSDGIYNPAQYNDRLLLGRKRPVSYCTSCSTSRHVSMISSGCLPTVELGHPSTTCSPSPAMPAADIPHMLAREGAPERRSPAALS